jgi:eukaryotic-like serine/threonine-protein kinase
VTQRLHWRPFRAFRGGTISSIVIGSTISHYKIVEKLGEGGMGVVYKAEDLKLGRFVALKFLPPHLLGSEEHKARFLQEARAAAVLDHPNICTVYEIDEVEGRALLAMAFLDGRTLKEKIAERPLPLAEALDITIQTAQGLQAAHEKGIVHRDIKPANIMITAQGRIKIMDFGLAQLGDRTKLTAPGTKLGTPAYMSPEQAEGKPADRRTDLWSLGVVLYEMVSGRMPFPGEAEAAVAYGILYSDPEPLTALRSGLPVELDRIVAKTLAKEPALRYQHVEDLVVDLRAMAAQLEPGKLSARRPVKKAPRRRGYLWAGAAVALLALALSFAYFRKSAPPTSAEWERITDFPDSATSPALSPDGRMVTFIRGASTFFGKGEIYVKMLPDGQPVQLTNDGLNKMSPVFSPDGSRIAYTVVVDAGSVWDTWIVPVLGGQPRRWLPNASGLMWLDNRRVLFSEIKTGMHMALVTATESRGEARDLYVPPLERGMVHRSYPSPDGKWVLLVEMENQGFVQCRVVPFDGSSEGRRVGPSGSCTTAAWSADGEQMYLGSNSGGSFHIWRQPFPDGTPEQITFGPTQEEGLALTPDGRSLLTSVGMEQSSVWVRDQRGERQASSEGNALLSSSLPHAFSPDGRRLYYLAEGALWAAELDSGRNERLLPDFERISDYDISRDGKQVAFSTLDSENRSHLWLAPLDLGSPPKALAPADADSPHFGPDGEIFFRGIEHGQNFIFRLAADHEKWGKVASEPVVGVISASPGGEWVVAGSKGYLMTAYPAEGGAGVRLCVRCFVGWTGDGKSLFVSWLVDIPSRQTRTYVLSIPDGSAFPALPPGGIETEEQLAALGSALSGEGVVGSFASDASVYAFTRSSQQRNIYKIPLP